MEFFSHAEWVQFILIVALAALAMAKIILTSHEKSEDKAYQRERERTLLINQKRNEEE